MFFHAIITFELFTIAADSGRGQLFCRLNDTGELARTFDFLFFRSHYKIKPSNGIAYVSTESLPR
nr:MAG TPA: hypothetical protein [Caudoviricetes sp.]